MRRPTISNQIDFSPVIGAASGSRFELVVQQEYLIILHPRLPHCLLLPRAQTAKDLASSFLGITVEEINDFPHLHGRRMVFDAIFGIFWLLKGPYLALVTESKSVGRGVDDKAIRQVFKIELMLIPTENSPLLTREQEEDEEK
jgi:hypothetical protein